VQVPAATNDTSPDPFTVHTPSVDEVTDFTPSPVVVTAGMNEPPTTRNVEAGRFEIVGAVGVPFPIVNVWVLPVAALKFVPAATTATTVHGPALRKVTFPVSGATEHTAGVDVVTDFTPSPVVVTAGMNEPPTKRPATAGRFEIHGTVGVSFTRIVWFAPLAAT